MRRAAVALAGFIFVSGVVAGTACGPVQYVSQVTRRASAEVEGARAAGAATWAPYEFRMAEQFLHKAREEEGYSHHQTAIRYGKKAELFARKAKKMAIERADGAPDPDDRGGGANPIDPSATPSSGGGE